MAQYIRVAHLSNVGTQIIADKVKLDHHDLTILFHTRLWLKLVRLVESQEVMRIALIKKINLVKKSIMCHWKRFNSIEVHMMIVYHRQDLAVFNQTYLKTHLQFKIKMTKILMTVH